MYEIRYTHSDGSLALLYMTARTSAEDAISVARAMCRPDFASFEIWNGRDIVFSGTLRREDIASLAQS